MTPAERAKKIEDTLRFISRYREEAHSHDDDMGHPRRPFDDEEEWDNVEELATRALRLPVEEAVPEHTVEVVEWKCDGALLAYGEV